MNTDHSTCTKSKIAAEVAEADSPQILWPYWAGFVSGAEISVSLAPLLKGWPTK